MQTAALHHFYGLHAPSARSDSTISDGIFKSQTKRKKKIAAAVYLYQVDNDGEWGEISFDFEAGTAEIIRLAEWDTMASKMFATKVVALILKNGDLQVKEFILPVSY